MTTLGTGGMFSGAPVAQHDDGQPDQPEGVRLTERGHGFGPLRGDQGPGRGRQIRSVGFHVSETPAASCGCVPWP